MSANCDLTSFLDAVSSDVSLQSAVAVASDPEALSQLAATRGYAVTPADLRAALGEDLAIETLQSSNGNAAICSLCSEYCGCSWVSDKPVS